MAIFIIETGFKLTGRGFVITGEIIEGAISAGNRIHTSEIEPLNGKVIRSVEFVDHIRTGTAKIGLLIPCQTVEELEEFLILDLQQKRIEIKV
jgi:selenocysteine-specific translation elongation factor